MKMTSIQNSVGIGESQPNASRVQQRGNKNEFLGELKRAQEGLVSTDKPTSDRVGSLKFSAHAVDRMQSRGIRFDQNTMQKIEDAVAKASEKGAKDTLVIAGEQALIVSVKNQTVVTVMDRASMRENVFTNIDSTVMI